MSKITSGGCLPKAGRLARSSADRDLMGSGLPPRRPKPRWSAATRSSIRRGSLTASVRPIIDHVDDNAKSPDSRSQAGSACKYVHEQFLTDAVGRPLVAFRRGKPPEENGGHRRIACTAFAIVGGEQLVPDCTHRDRKRTRLN